MNENIEKLAHLIVHEAYQIHNDIGVGLFESVYEAILMHRLEKHGLQVKSQQILPIEYDELRFEKAFIIDLLVEDQIIIELKSVERIAPIHKKQLLTYLRLSGCKLGFLINFGESYFKKAITRMVNEYY